MSKRPPKGWKTFKIGEIGSFFSGLKNKTADDFGRGEPFLTYMQVLKQSLSSIMETGLVEIKEGENQSTVQYGDILFTTSSETPDEVGMTSVYLERDRSPYLNSFCFGLRPQNEAILSPEFAHHFFRGNKFRTDIQPLSQGSTRYNLSRRNLAKLFITVPPIPEQRKIASIITSVDEVIEGIQTQIKKLRGLKKATMNELLTEGIGHTEFRDSESGRIPKGWIEYALGQLGKIVGGGTPSSKISGYWGGSVMWATPTEITNLEGRYISKTNRTITEEGLQNSSAKLHPKGTILVTTRASIGFPAINLAPMATNQGFQSLQPNEKLDVEYGYQAFLQNRGRLKRLSAGSTFLEISSKEMKKFKLAVPLLPEQKKIAKILTSLDKNIEQKQKKLHHIQLFKKSLMQDLLTGSVRVVV